MTERGTLLGGRYELDQVIGRGGMAEVWRARDTRLQRDVAVKRLRIDLASDPTFQARFRREAQSSAGLNHPNIVAVYDTGEEKDTNSGVMVPFIVMELVEGVTLREVLRGGRKIVPEKALEFTAGVLDALAYSHRAGIIHRDIKPANVMFTPPGTVKVMDFGIARAVADTSATMTQTAAVIGTAQYLSPEQARGLKVDNRSDIYAVGCLLYELLVSEPPFKGDSPVSVVFQHVRETPVRPSERDPEVTAEMDAIVMKSLAKDPRDRYQDAQEMRADILRVLNNQPIATQIPAFTDAPTQVIAADPITTTARRAALPAAAGGAAVAAGAGSAAAMTPHSGATPPEAEEEEKPNRGPLILLGVLGGLLLLGLIIMMFLLFNRDPAPAATPSPSVTQTESASPTPSPSPSASPDLVKVPHVKGMNEADGLNKLRDAGFNPKPVYVEGDENNNGKIDKTDPAEGSEVKAGSEIKVYVFEYEAPDLVQVPNFDGMTRAEAEAAASKAGLTVTFEEVETADRPDGKVFSQTPGKNEEVEKGAAVTLQVAVAPKEEPPTPEMVQVPDFTGKSLEEAKSAASSAGLTLVPEMKETADHPEGTVFDQKPKAGKEVAKGGSVSVDVAVTPAEEEPPSEPTSPVPPTVVETP